MTVRVGFVGCGALANRMHYPSLAELPHAELVAICDLYTWKLLRRDLGLSRRQTEDAIREMLEGILE